MAAACPRDVGASGADRARLLLYLEVPRAIAAANTLRPGALVLSGPARTVELESRLDALVSTELAGRQVLLASAEVPAGVYTLVQIGLIAIEGEVGVARVAPSPPAGGVEIPVDLELRAAATDVVFLEWRPAGIDPGSEFHVPDIRRMSTTIPPLGSLALVTSRGAGSLIIIDRLAGRVAGARWIDEDPRDIAWSRLEQTFYVALAGADAIGVVDALSLRVINRIPVQFGDDPTRLLISRDGSLLFVLSPGSRTVSGLSVFSLQEQFRVPVGEGPRSFAQDPVTGSLYVACEGEGTVQVIDPARGARERSLTIAPAPVEVVVDERARRLYAGGSIQRRVYFFDLETGTGGDLNLCGPIFGLAYNPLNQRLYAGLPSCRQLAVVRPETGLEYSPVDLPSAPGLMAFDQEYRQLLVVLSDDGAVGICNPNRGRLETLIDVDEKPFGVMVP